MEDYVSSRIARKLKEKGFPLRKVYRDDYTPLFYDLPRDHPDWSYCDAWYIPRITQVLKWLRKEKKIHVEIVACAYGYNYIVSKTPPYGTELHCSQTKWEGPNDGGAWDDYEPATIAAIEYILDNLI